MEGQLGSQAESSIELISNVDLLTLVGQKAGVMV